MRLGLPSVVQSQYSAMAVCVAVIDKDNAPLFIRSIADGNCDQELRFHYSVHSSLDIVEEKLSGSQATSKSADLRELYLGLLLSTEDFKAYGFATNTRIKFILLIDIMNTSLKDNEIRGIFRKLHNAYTNAICNPFYIPGRPLQSKNFNSIVEEILRLK